jgi:hypothetical protein
MIDRTLRQLAPGPYLFRGSSMAHISTDSEAPAPANLLVDVVNVGGGTIFALHDAVCGANRPTVTSTRERVGQTFT